MKEGRPLGVKGKTRGLNTSFYVTGEELEILEEIRWRERKSMSALVRIAIDEYIKSHSEGNDTFKLDTWNDNPDFQAVPTIHASLDKWGKYYDDCNPQEKIKLNVELTKILKIFNNRNLNSKRKKTAEEIYQEMKSK